MITSMCVITLWAILATVASLLYRFRSSRLVKRLAELQDANLRLGSLLADADDQILKMTRARSPNL